MNPSELTNTAFQAHIEEARRHAEAQRRARNTAADEVVIRRAARVDQDALERLAQLDSANAPDGQTLVAEVSGRLVAAIGVEGGAAVADPFQRTAEVVDLLELRAGQLRAARQTRAASVAVRRLGRALRGAVAR